MIFNSFENYGGKEAMKGVEEFTKEEYKMEVLEIL